MFPTAHGEAANEKVQMITSQVVKLCSSSCCRVSIQCWPPPSLRGSNDRGQFCGRDERYCQGWRLLAESSEGPLRAVNSHGEQPHLQSTSR